MDNQYDVLIGYQRAEFARAAMCQLRIIRVQFALLATTCGAIFLTYEPLVYATAILSFVLALTWAWLNWQYKTARAVGERARRATFFMGGLGFAMTPHEYREFQMNFTVAPDMATQHQSANYYASRTEHGWERLLEMLEEAAFWSAHLLDYSARRYWAFVVGTLAVLLVVFVSIAPFLTQVAIGVAAKLGCAIIATLVSADVLGAALQYSAAASEIRNIQSRIQNTKGNPADRVGELLMLIADYNSAVESAPMFVGGLYERHQQRLNKLWDSSKRPTTTD